MTALFAFRRYVPLFAIIASERELLPNTLRRGTDRPNRCVTRAIWTNHDGVQSDGASRAVGDALLPLSSETA